MRLIILCAASLLLAGCAAREQLPDYSQSVQRDLPPTHFETVITSRAGTRLSATVFQPALKAGEQAPLVVHTHGWGGWAGYRAEWVLWHPDDVRPRGADRLACRLLGGQLRPARLGRQRGRHRNDGPAL